MGKLKDLRAEYIKTRKNTPRDRELVEAIKKIVESDWWEDKIGKPFNWPIKDSAKWKGYGLDMGYETRFEDPNYPEKSGCIWVEDLHLLTSNKGLLSNNKSG